MRLAQTRWHHDVFDQLSAHVVCCHAEHAFGGGIAKNDLTVEVRHDHGVQRGLVGFGHHGRSAGNLGCAGFQITPQAERQKGRQGGHCPQ